MLLDRVVFCLGVFLVCAVAVFNNLRLAPAQATTWSAPVASVAPIAPAAHTPVRAGGALR